MIYRTLRDVGQLFSSLKNSPRKKKLQHSVANLLSMHVLLLTSGINPLSANPTKQPNTLKQFVG